MSLSKLDFEGVIRACHRKVNGVDCLAVSDSGMRTDFSNASGIFTANIAATTAVANGVRTDFDNASGIWMKPGDFISSPFSTLAWASGLSVDLAGKNNLYLPMGSGNATITALTNPVDGGKYSMVVKQNDAGSKTLSFPSNVKWKGASAPTLTAASGSVDIFILVYQSSLNTFWADVGQNFA